MERGYLGAEGTHVVGFRGTEGGGGGRMGGEGGGGGRVEGVFEGGWGGEGDGVVEVVRLGLYFFCGRLRPAQRFACGSAAGLWSGFGFRLGLGDRSDECVRGFNPNRGDCL